MHTLAADRPEFAPPPQRGTWRALLLALIAHALLIAALTWGVRWKRDSEDAAVEAELWSTTVQEAAPRAISPAPPPAPTSTPTPAPPPPPPAPPARMQEPTPAPRTPDIALEREKKLKEQQERRERELEQARQKKQEAARKAAEEKKQLEAQKREQEEAQRKEAEQKLAAQKKKEAEAKQTAAQTAKDREAAIRRMQALAGSGAENSTGTAARASGPSGGYGARIAAAVKPNIVYPDADNTNGNPRVEFDVKLAPDGTIVGVQLRKSSGVPAWDLAAERGLRKTDKLPRDTDGRIFPSLTVGLRPKD